ncbi:LysR family transcriptional regulator [Chelatococcus reniformis]|nr:LysR family transcriptional regulator [Chelatococcus reniformis]
MQISRSDLADFAYFLAIARHRSFRRAGLELGVSASALSHALKGLEARLAVRLFNRTNRSVTLTAAGEELLAAISEPFDLIGQSVQALDRFRTAPVGRVRLNALDDAATLLLGPVLPVFAERYPEIEIELSVNNRLIDVIEQGYDAGIRFEGTVPADMIAQRLTPDFRWIVVGSPAYLERWGTPEHPSDLLRHRCLNIRLGNGRIYRWEFEKSGEAVAVTVPGAITIDQSAVARSLAISGTGLMYAPEQSVAPQLHSGTLRIVLADWAPGGAAFCIYYSSRRHLPTGLRLLIELIRELRPLGG